MPKGIMSLRQDARWNLSRRADAQGIMSLRQDAPTASVLMGRCPGNHVPAARCAMASVPEGRCPGNHVPAARCAMESVPDGRCPGNHVPWFCCEDQSGSWIRADYMRPAPGAKPFDRSTWTSWCAVRPAASLCATRPQAVFSCFVAPLAAWASNRPFAT
jgi:hypothetical protein